MTGIFGLELTAGFTDKLDFYCLVITENYVIQSLISVVKSNKPSLCVEAANYKAVNRLLICSLG